MTIALGFFCHDGVVLCADSLESDGYTKHHVNKIQLFMQPHKKWGVAVAGAGDSAVYNTFIDRLRATLNDAEYDQEDLENKIGSVYKFARQKYQNTPFRILVALYGYINLAGKLSDPTGKPIPGLWHGTLYRDNNENCLERIAAEAPFAAAGLGESLSALFQKTLCDWRMSVYEAAELGIHIIGLAKEHVDGCGGQTNVVIYQRGKETFERHYKSDSTLNITKLETSQLKKFNKTLESYWKKQSRARGMPRHYQTPHDKMLKEQKRKK